jgi:hypothetical protein
MARRPKYRDRACTLLRRKRHGISRYRSPWLSRRVQHIDRAGNPLRAAELWSRITHILVPALCIAAAGIRAGARKWSGISHDASPFL